MGISRTVQVLGIATLLTACAGVPVGDAGHGLVPDAELQTAGHFYWPYAALAADVYRTGGVVDTQVPVALSSRWLRSEVDRMPPEAPVRMRFSSLGVSAARGLIDAARTKRCRDSHAPDSIDCTGRAASVASEDTQDLEEAVDEDNRYRRAVPEQPEDCDFRDSKPPAVPLDDAVAEFGWEPVPELHRVTSARGWSVFVPDLAIDVWRRPRGEADGRPTIEYAMVFRGTIGGGGWVSNLRALTAWTPFVWDQYRQARHATRQIIEQIYRLHTLGDALFERDRGTRILVTAVGHSLGGGLAKHIFLRTPEVTRVVGFNASPVDGSAMVAPDLRVDVLGPRRFPHDADARDPDARMFLWFEHGEILSRLAPCHSGPLWGDEGGPRVRCEGANLSSGNWVRQHSISQMACRLYLLHKGRPYRRARAP